MKNVVGDFEIMEFFMWDFRKDWDLNYEDYVGISREEVCK